MIVNGSASRSASARWSFQVEIDATPAGKDAAARAANAGAPAASASRISWVQCQRLRSGSIRSSVARVSQATPGLLRG
jgi:hypothetical protein